MTRLMTVRTKLVNKCVKPTRKKILVVRKKKEEKRKLIIENKKQDLLIEVELDGCYAQGTTEKCCDYLVRHKGINYYIELKGGNYEETFAQIISAIQQFNTNFDGDECRAIIVTSKSPSVPAFNKAFKRSKLWRYICKKPIKRSASRPYILS